MQKIAFHATPVTYNNTHIGEKSYKAVKNHTDRSFFGGWVNRPVWVLGGTRGPNCPPGSATARITCTKMSWDVQAPRLTESHVGTTKVWYYAWYYSLNGLVGDFVTDDVARSR